MAQRKKRQCLWNVKTFSLLSLSYIFKHKSAIITHSAFKAMMDSFLTQYLDGLNLALGGKKSMVRVILVGLSPSLR